MAQGLECSADWFEGVRAVGPGRGIAVNPRKKAWLEAFCAGMRLAH